MLPRPSTKEVCLMCVTGWANQVGGWLLFLFLFCFCQPRNGTPAAA